MGIIVIIRHGKYLRERNDGHLTKEGIYEIQKAAETLKRDLNGHFNFSRIFHSPLIRSRETAEIFQKIIGKKIIEDSRISDPKMDLEIHFAMVKSLICNPKNLSTGQVYFLTRQPEGFETYEEVAARFSNFMNDLICGLENADGVVIISHAPTVDYLLLQHFNTGLCEGNDIQYGEFLKIFQTNDRLFEIEFRGKNVKVRSKELLFNQLQFLSEKKKRR